MPSFSDKITVDKITGQRMYLIRNVPITPQAREYIMWAADHLSGKITESGRFESIPRYLARRERLRDSLTNAMEYMWASTYGQWEGIISVHRIVETLANAYVKRRWFFEPSSHYEFRKVGWHPHLHMALSAVRAMAETAREADNV